VLGASMRMVADLLILSLHLILSSYPELTDSWF